MGTVPIWDIFKKRAWYATGICAKIAAVKHLGSVFSGRKVCHLAQRYCTKKSRWFGLAS